MSPWAARLSINLAALAAAVALVGVLAAQPASAEVVQAGSSAFNVLWSCNSTNCPGNTNATPSSTLSAQATFSNFAFSNNGQTFTMDVLIENTTPQGSLSASDWQSVRVTSFGFNTLPDATGISETGASVFTGTALEKNFPSFQNVDICSYAGSNCSGGGNGGLFPTGSGKTPNSDSFQLILTGLPTGTTSIDLGTDVAGASELFDIKYQTGFGSFEFQGSPNTSVPEPMSLALFGTALAGLGMFGRLRRS
jgi:hypothetical protein